MQQQQPKNASWRCTLAAALSLSCTPGTRTPAHPLSNGLDPTPLARCQVGAGAQNPLVTEWAASEKARLESLLGTQPVFVRYTGCELSLVDQCRVEGSYEWIRTTLASDTVDIRSEDELYAKLPIGAAKLEGELRNSGRLQVRTRVAGQLRLTGTGLPDIAASSACDAATHVVSAVSLGAFQLKRGSQDSIGGSIDAHGAGVAGGSRQAEEVMHEAGVDGACEETTSEVAHPNCASPLQLFLTPLRTEPSGPPPDAPDAVHIHFPAKDDEPWTLHDAEDKPLCTTPCQYWVPPHSGYVLREGTRSVKIPDDLAFASGEEAVASYHPRRGRPTGAKWMFWSAGVWLSAPGIALTTIGITQATADPIDCTNSTDPFCDEDENDKAAFFLVGGAVFLSAFGASLWYYLYTEEESFTLQRPGSVTSNSSQRTGRSLQVGPGFLRGTF